MPVACRSKSCPHAYHTLDTGVCRRLIHGRASKRLLCSLAAGTGIGVEFYRGLEQLVARKAHNLEAAAFESRTR